MTGLSERLTRHVAALRAVSRCSGPTETEMAAMTEEIEALSSTESSSLLRALVRTAPMKVDGDRMTWLGASCRFIAAYAAARAWTLANPPAQPPENGSLTAPSAARP